MRILDGGACVCPDEPSVLPWSVHAEPYSDAEILKTERQSGGRVRARRVSATRIASPLHRLQEGRSVLALPVAARDDLSMTLAADMDGPAVNGLPAPGVTAWNR